MIREATLDDVPVLVEMGRRFLTETPYREQITPDEAQMAQTVENVLESPGGVFLVAGDPPHGMIGLLTYAHPFSGEKTVFEMVWWVNPEHRGQGVRLLAAAEKWAAKQGAVLMQVAAPNDRVGELYRRMGYTSTETSFQRRL